MKLAFAAAPGEAAAHERAHLVRRYGEHAAADSDAIVAIGGDGFMLQSLHRHLRYAKPLFGLKTGTLGFLMNPRGAPNEDLLARVANAQATELYPLRMQAQREAGTEVEALAFNEVSLLRQTRQAAHLRVVVNEVTRVEELVCDGLLVATPAGSTAYNYSANGPILPIGGGVLAMTPISPFRPRRWRGAVLRHEARVRIDVLDAYKRPVSATADASEVRDVISVEIAEDRSRSAILLFDPDASLDERMLSEQFAAG